MWNNQSQNNQSLRQMLHVNETDIHNFRNKWSTNSQLLKTVNLSLRRVLRSHTQIICTEIIDLH